MIIATLMSICIIMTTGQFVQTFDQFLKSTPTTFGLLVYVSVSPGQKYDQIKNELENYAKMQCKEMKQISVVLNSYLTVQKLGIKQSRYWKRPLHYYYMPQTNPDLRFKLSKNSNAHVYFSINVNDVVQCQHLIQSFNLWRQKAVGDIGPLIGYEKRGFDINILKKQIKYVNPLEGRFYSVILPRLCWIPRHMLELYYSQALEELITLKKITSVNDNCQDIALNFIIRFFYIQFDPIAIQDKNGLVSFQKQSDKIATKESQCLKNIIDQIGIIPFSIFDQKSTTGGSYIKQIIYNKRRFIENHIINGSPQIDYQPLIHWSLLAFFLGGCCLLVHVYYVRQCKLLRTLK